MKKMKIAYLSVFHPYRGGIAQFNNELFLALQEYAEVKAFNFKRQYPTLLFPGETQLVNENDPDPKINADQVLDSVGYFSWLKAVKAIKQFNPDLVITAYWMPFFSPALSFVLKRIKVKKLAILHNVIPHEQRAFDTLLNKKYLKVNDEFIVLSETVEKQLLSLLPSAKYQLIPHPLYRHFGQKMSKELARAELKLPKEGECLLFFGFIRKYKGLKTLCEAVKVLSPSVHLIVAGENYEDEAFIDELRSLLGEDVKRVHFFDRYISDGEVKKYFSAADLLVLPYLSATQSGIAAIGKHFELPMVVSNVGELPNEIQEGTTGCVFEAGNQKQLAEKLTSALKNKEAMAQAMARENEHNTFENFAKRLMHI